MRKVCVVVGSRANYSSIKSAMRAIEDRDDLELQLVVGASALLDRYGSVENLIEQDGFEADERVFMLIEGETPSTMAKSTGLGLLELPTAFERLQPDVVITVGDRFETMATALAATSDVPVGGCAVFSDEKVVITQPEEGEFKAFSSVCTHQGCTVSASSDGAIPCGCHGSKFSLEDGSVIAGPATAPLSEVAITIEGDSITLA